VYVLPVEAVTVAPGSDSLFAIVVRVPEDASLQGDLAITLALRGVKSNTAVISIGSP